MEIAFNDIAGVQTLVSDKFGDFGEPITITQAMIDRFAEITMDQQWIHVDVERAKQESPFGGTIAHGFLTLSMLTALKPGKTAAKLTGFGSVINYGADKLRFISPVLAGSDIHARKRIAAVRRKGPATQVTFETEVWVVGAERPALLYRSLALFLPEGFKGAGA